MSSIWQSISVYCRTDIIRLESVVPLGDEDDDSQAACIYSRPMKSSVLLELCLVIPCVRLIVINQTVVQDVGYYALVVK